MILKIYFYFSRIVKIFFFRRSWRKINIHNETIAKDIFPKNIVTVGRKSYGFIDIKYFFHDKERLQIGNYVSIADNVQFILGGNHTINIISTFPLYSKLIKLSPKHDAHTKGSIIIEDEVWIGNGSTILSGVKIGKGAIIAAGAVVTKDVLPYMIVGGNPAKVIKSRFNEEIINALNNLNISDFDEKVIIENIEEFYQPIDLKQIEKLNKIKQKIKSQ